MTPLEELQEHLRRWTRGLSDPAQELERCARLGIALLPRSSERYPELLRSIPGAPRVLYVRGVLPLLRPALAIVGARAPSLYGRRMARSLAEECAGAGIAVVSGLARGIDGEAHGAAVRKGGATWAVLGSALDRIYPAEHERLARAIVDSGGALVSEVPLGVGPQPGFFPARNRIISGLAMGTIVVEGKMKSGSLITAKCALEQGREVFAVPGPADSELSEAPNSLLRDGAGLVSRLSDILGAFPALDASLLELPNKESGAADGFTLEQKKILELLGSQPLGLEELMRETGWDLPRLLQDLTYMEGRGLLRTLPGQHYARI
ncbi:MAG: DNA protecting protein DprA [Elusimicrobia bacterium GWA2_69_24]|nr:MAG: DNA protecting protein DprA [Elusimicrobia bacterium GWA2_69_24]